MSLFLKRLLDIFFTGARASEEKYRLISQISSDYTFSTALDEQGNMYLNWVAGAIEKITGYTFDEYVESGGWATHLHPDDMEKDAQDMATLRNNLRVITELRTFTKNKELRWVRVYAHPVWDENANRLKGIVGAVQDITDQKITEAALKYERDLLQIFMDNIPDAVYFKDTESHFVRVNRTQSQLLGLEDPERAIGTTDLDFQDPPLAAQLLAEEQQIVKTGASVINRIEFNIARDGTPRWISVTKVPARDSHGSVIGTIGISRDITSQKQVEETLNQNIIQQAAILNNIPDMAWLKDKDGRYIAVNEQFAKVAGLSINEILGKTDFDIWPEDFARGYRDDDIYVISTRHKRLIEERQRDHFDREYWIETVKTPIFNTLGEVVGTTGLARDITERKEAEDVEERRREMLEKVIELGKYVTAASDLKTTLNKIWHGIHDNLGFERLAIFLYNPERNSMDDTLGTNNEGQLVENWDLSFPIDSTFSQVLAKPDGLYFTNNYAVENNIPEGHEMFGVKDFAAVAAWAGDKPVAVICADNLVTKKIITHDQLEALRLFAGYAGMAIENARLNETIQNELLQRKTFIKDLESKNAELEQFTYTVSHDLKSPLVTIKGFLGYIEQDAVKGNFGQLHSDIDRIDKAVVKMQILLKDLLELSRIGRLINQPVEFKFGEIVNDALDLVRGQLNAKPVMIEVFDKDDIVYGDRGRLTEVMQNLLDNAIKFTGEQSKPQIKIGSTVHPKYGKAYYVKDNGIGIESKYYERIFGLFNKLDSKSQGTGIGLSLVKRIIEVHGGALWVESEPNRGSTFYFTLPNPHL